MALNDAMLQKFVDDALAASQPKFGDVSSPMLADAGVTMPTSSSGRLSTGSSMPRQQMPSVASLTMNPYAGPGTPSKQVDPKKAFWMGTLADVADSMGGTGPAQFQRGAQQQAYAQAQNRGQLPGQVAARKMQYDQWEKAEDNRISQAQLKLQQDKARIDQEEKTLTDSRKRTTYERLLGSGVTDLTMEEFSNLSDQDVSKLVQRRDQNLQGRQMSREEMRNEYDLQKMKPDSVQKALESGDPGDLEHKPWADPAAKISAQKTMRDDYNKAVAPFRGVQEMYTKTLSALNRGSGAGDMAAIFSFMKTLDPRSTVREGEFALAAQVGGLRDRWLNTYDRFDKGEILPNDARRQLAEIAQDMLLLTRDNYDAVQDDYKYLTKNAGLDERSVMGTRTFDYENLKEFKSTVDAGDYSKMSDEDLLK